MDMITRKILSAFLVVALLCLISACGASSDNTSKQIPTTKITVAPSTNTPKQTATPKPTATPTPKDGLKSDGKIHVYLVGKGEKVNTPNSSFIDYLVYYSSSKHLIVCMNGKEYVFANVSSSLWSDFKSADSVGTFYNQNIRGNTSFHITDYDGSNGDLIVMDYVN